MEIIICLALTMTTLQFVHVVKYILIVTKYVHPTVIKNKNIKSKNSETCIMHIAWKSNVLK